MRGFLAPDVAVIGHMEPREGALIDGLDDGAARYWACWRGPEDGKDLIPGQAS